MSKPMLVTLPFVLLLLDYWPLGRIQSNTPASELRTLRRLILEKLPLFGLSAASCALTLWAQGKGAVRTDLPLGLRLANAVVSYAKYLGQTVWPAKLAIFYQHPNARYFAPHDSPPPAFDQWSAWLLSLAS